MTGVPQERRVVTAIPGPRSVELMRRRAAAVAPGVATTLPVFVEAAGGGVVVDVDGNSLIDFGAGIAVVSVGNASPAVVAAVTEQVRRFTHTCFQVTPYESYVAVCEALNRLTPGSHEKRSMLTNSGAEAVENAVKVARRATGRPAVVTFDHAFHGRTLLTMSLTAKASPYKSGFGPLAPDVHRVPYSYPYRCPAGADHEHCATACADVAIDMMERLIGASQIACVVVEPLQGEGGVIVPGQGFLPRIFEWCKANGVLTVADEVQTGFGRTGAWFACEHEDLVPDIVTTAKALAGGLPLGGVTARAELMDAVHVGGLGGTFSGNPVACAAALATIDQIESEGLVQRSAQIGEWLLARLRSLAGASSVIGDVRGRGAMVAVELVGPGKIPAPDVATAVMKACHAEGLLVLKAGSYDNVLRIVPPLVIGDALLEEGMTIIEKAFDAVEHPQGHG